MRIYFKHGSKSAVDNYVGHSNEIIVDTDSNTLRLCDGETRGGFEIPNSDIIDRKISAEISDLKTFSELPHIIETYTNGSSWYRVFSDGWCEQGGLFGEQYTAYSEKTFTFLKPFKDDKFYAFCHCSNSSDLNYPSIKVKNKNYVTFVNTYNENGLGNWLAVGYIDLED